MKKIVMVGWFKWKITGVTFITFDSYWKVKEYLYNL